MGDARVTYPNVISRHRPRLVGGRIDGPVAGLWSNAPGTYASRVASGGGAGGGITYRSGRAAALPEFLTYVTR